MRYQYIWFFILLCCNITYATVNKSCTKLLAELGDSQSKFIYAVTTSAVPFTICQNTKNKHDAMVVNFSAISEKCSAEFFDKDRLNILPTVNSMLTTLWTKAYCDDCFDANKMDAFQNLRNDLNECFHNNLNKSCEFCRIPYDNLNKFYTDIDQHNNGNVCFDMQDAMNRTRSMWSKQCCQRQFNIVFFIIAVSIISAFPLLFYCSVYALTKRQERNHGVLTNDPDLNVTRTPAIAIETPTSTIVRPIAPIKNINLFQDDDSDSDNDININTSKLGL